MKISPEPVTRPSREAVHGLAFAVEAQQGAWDVPPEDGEQQQGCQNRPSEESHFVIGHVSWVGLVNERKNGCTNLDDSFNFSSRLHLLVERSCPHSDLLPQMQGRAQHSGVAGPLALGEPSPNSPRRSNTDEMGSLYYRDQAQSHPRLAWSFVPNGGHTPL